MQKLIEFLLRETPGHAKEIQSDIGLLLSSIENTQSAIEGMMPSIDKGDYAKIGEYYSMAHKMGNLREQLAEMEQYFGIEEPMPQEDEEELRDLPNIEKKDYDACRVDESVAHGLFENYTYKRPVAFTLEGNRYSARDWKQILRMICELLNQKDSNIFDSFVRDKDMQGSTRTYFAYTDNRMYNGKKVSGSNVYVETNHNANGICSIIANMLERYNIPVTSVKIYLRSDYTPLHVDEENVKKN